MVTDYLASIRHAADGRKRLPRHRIARLDFQCFLEAAHRVAVHFFSQIRAPQVVVRKMSRLVTARFRGALQPGNRFLETAQLDQVRANVVVRIAELPVDLDLAPTFCNGFFDSTTEMITP